MTTPASRNVSEIIDASAFGKFQIGIFILCELCLIMDGSTFRPWGMLRPSSFRHGTSQTRNSDQCLVLDYSESWSGRFFSACCRTRSDVDRY